MRVYMQRWFMLNNLTLIPLNGKRPIHKDWLKRDYTAPTEDGQYGVKLTDELVVLDVDPRSFETENKKEALENFFNAFEGLSQVVQSCPKVLTGGGGLHYYMRKLPEWKLKNSLSSYPGFELKSKGRQVVAPGARHPSGEYYRWAEDQRPDDGYKLNDLPMLPESVYKAFKKQKPGPKKLSPGEASDLISAEELKELLSVIKAEDYRDHDRWLELLMSAHAATGGTDEAMEVFVHWSTSDPEYRGDGPLIEQRWSSFDANGLITSGFLLKETAAFRDAISDFEPIDVVDVEDDRPPEEAALDYMNERYGVVLMNGSRLRIVGVPERSDSPIILTTRSDFIDYLAGAKFVNSDGDAKALAPFWLKHPRRRKYQGLHFRPDLPPAAEDIEASRFNIWRGWAVKDDATKSWSYLADLIYEVLADSSEENNEYILNWLAFMIQQPATLPGVALCFTGEKGIGKSTLGRVMLSMMHESNAMAIASSERLTGRFNAHLRSCLFLFADEAFWAGDKTGESALKQLLTEPKIAFEAKNMDPEVGNNFIHVMMASNNEWIVPAGLDGERRFAVFKANTKRQGDFAFFTKLHKQLYKDGGLEGFFHFLKTKDLTGWEPSKVPQTEALIEQKLNKLEPEHEFWLDVLTSGDLPNEASWEEQDGQFTPQALYTQFVAWAKDAGIRKRHRGQQGFMRAMRTVIGPDISRAKFTPRSATEAVDTPVADSQGRINGYKIGSLLECRKFMEKRLGGPIDWD